MKKSWVLSYPLSAQRRLRSDWADAQADLSFRWAHTHFVGFVMSWLTFVFFLNMFYYYYYYYVFRSMKQIALQSYEGCSLISAIGLITFTVSAQWLCWKNCMPTLHKNFKENECSGLIRHLDGIVLWHEPQFQYKYYHLYKGFLYL